MSHASWNNPDDEVKSFADTFMGDRGCSVCSSGPRAFRTFSNQV